MPSVVELMSFVVELSACVVELRAAVVELYSVEKRSVEWERVLLNINTDSLVTFMIVWGLSAIMVVKTFLKMDTDEKKSVIADCSSRRFIFTIGLFITGSFLTHLSIVFPILIIKGMGIALLSIGGFISIVNVWKESKLKSIGLLILLSILIFLIKQLLF